MRYVLVFGGAGFIGSHVCKALFKAGITPVVYDNLSTGHAYAVKWGPFIQGDLQDRNLLDSVMRQYAPEAVLHFAASAIVSESIRNPGKYYENNVANTLSLLEAMRQNGVHYLVFSSTCATYGNPLFCPITEEHPQIPISPYGKSKRMVEEILADFEAAYGMRSIVLRYFNAAGADSEREIGEDHTPETHIIPLVIQTALNMKEAITIYGTDFPTADGTAVRDYIHVQDLADAHLRALRWLLAERKSVSINLGTGVGHSILDIIREVEAFSGRKVCIRRDAIRVGDPAYLTADNQKARKILGWCPQVSHLPFIIQSAWRWQEFLLKKRAGAALGVEVSQLERAARSASPAP